MKSVSFTFYELNDLLRFLEYTKVKKTNDYKEGKIKASQFKYELGILEDITAKLATPNIKSRI